MARVKLTVTDVNPAANATFLEGYIGEVKLTLMKDYDLDGDPTNDKVGDVHHFNLIRVTPAAKVIKRKVVKPKPPTPAQKRAKLIAARVTAQKKTRPYMKSRAKASATQTRCPGSGDKMPKGDAGTRQDCISCGRKYMVTGAGYMRTHY